MGRSRTENALRVTIAMRTVLIPWLRLEPEEIIAMSKRGLKDAPEWMAIEPFFHSIPSLGTPRSDSKLLSQN